MKRLLLLALAVVWLPCLQALELDGDPQRAATLRTCDSDRDRGRQAEARQRQALASYQKAVETAFREVADALSNVQQTADTETDLNSRVDAARKSLRLSKLRYEAGYSGYLEVLDAQRTLNDAEVALVRNRQSRLAYSVDLMKALGGGWAPASASTVSAAPAGGATR